MYVVGYAAGISLIKVMRRLFMFLSTAVGAGPVYRAKEREFWAELCVGEGGPQALCC